MEATNVIEDNVDPLAYKTDIDYTVIYDKENDCIRFASDDMHVLSEVDVYVFTVGGRLLYTFKADQQQSLVELPGGTYIVRWALGENTKSVKLKK